MRHMVRIAVAVMVASLLAGVPLSADDDDDDRDDDRNERRIRKSQLVILNAMPDCDAGIMTIGGKNFGTSGVHATLNLIELEVMSADSENVVVYLPAEFCSAPATNTNLLTIMRNSMRYRRRWLKLRKKDLGTFDVTIGAATLDDVAGLRAQVDDNAGDIDTNAAGVAGNTTDIATNTTGVAGNATDIATNTTGVAGNATDIATNAGGIATNAGGIATSGAGIAANTGDIATNTAAIAALGAGGGAGGGGSSLLHVNGKEHFQVLGQPPGFSVPAGTLSANNNVLRISAQGGLATKRECQNDNLLR